MVDFDFLVGKGYPPELLHQSQLLKYRQDVWADAQGSPYMITRTR